MHECCDDCHQSFPQHQINYAWGLKRCNLCFRKRDDANNRELDQRHRRTEMEKIEALLTEKGWDVDKLVSIVKQKTGPIYQMIDELKKFGEISEMDGTWHCKKCHGTIDIDWFDQTLECLGCDDLYGDAQADPKTEEKKTEGA